MTREQILDAIASIELHHFRGTSVVACCVLDNAGRAHLGIGSAIDGQEPDLTEITARARAAAEEALAKTMKGQADGN